MYVGVRGECYEKTTAWYSRSGRRVFMMPAMAASVTWTVSGPILGNNPPRAYFETGTVWGTFDYDASTNIYSNVLIYDHNAWSSDSDYGPWGGLEVPRVWGDESVSTSSSSTRLRLRTTMSHPDCMYADCVRSLDLHFASPLTSLGGQIALTTVSGAYLSNPGKPTQSGYLWPDEGFVLGATAVPVPATAWLFGSAIGLLGWMRRRQV